MVRDLVGKPGVGPSTEVLRKSIRMKILAPKGIKVGIESF